jgi:molybdenum cofactor sulfurtransferase
MMGPAYQETRLASALGEFVAAHPAFSATAGLDELRRTDFSRLDGLGHVYLDHTGGGLYPRSLVERHLGLLNASVLGNPHSENPTSMASAALVEEAREAVLSYFGASRSDYEVIFTPNASGALRLVGEAYPFKPGARYLLTYDNHNSVNGIREFARRKGAAVEYVPVLKPDLRVDTGLLRAAFDRLPAGEAGLFAYPAQSNFSGVQHPLEWVGEASELGWDVVLDAAAFAPTNRLDMGHVRPDFVALSFYKMFGYPTGVGALIARRSSLEKLERPWFAGGTIRLASVQDESWHSLAAPPASFEDGTVDYLGIPAVTLGLEYVAGVGVDVIHDRVMTLTSWLLVQMDGLRHGNGSPLVRVFGPRDVTSRGGTVAFYVLDQEGGVFDVFTVGRLAAREGISIRTGCFCNPGDGEVAHDIARQEMEECFTAECGPMTFEECHELIKDSTGKTPNTLRASLGLSSDFSDVYRFMGFLEGFVDLSQDGFAARALQA